MSDVVQRRDVQGQRQDGGEDAPGTVADARVGAEALVHGQTPEEQLHQLPLVEPQAVGAAVAAQIEGTTLRGAVDAGHLQVEAPTHAMR